MSGVDAAYTGCTLSTNGELVDVLLLDSLMRVRSGLTSSVAFLSRSNRALSKGALPPLTELMLLPAGLSLYCSDALVTFTGWSDVSGFYITTEQAISYYILLHLCVTTDKWLLSIKVSLALR
jgi:hypothetical protein